MRKNLHSIYIVISPIVIIILLFLTILYWKQKRNCEKNVKETMCLCNGAQTKTICRPYNLNSNLGLDVNSQKQKGPPELKMKYDYFWTGSPPNFVMPYENRYTC